MRTRSASIGLLGLIALASCAEASTTEAAPVSRPPVAVTLPCDRALTQGQGGVVPEPGYDEVIRGQVALPARRAIQVGPSGDGDPNLPWFAKAGLVFQSGAEFDVVVPREWRGKAAISWAGTPRTSRLRVTGCDAPPDSWLAFPGGYWVSEPGCIPIVIESGDRTVRVHIGIGIACPGQDPVPDGVPNLGTLPTATAPSGS